MTYLGFPRLHFSGSFQADPSTVNNEPSHFNSAQFAARFQQRQTAHLQNGWWNPRGSGAWRLRNCRVTSVIYGDGSLVTSPDADPIVGGLLCDAGDRVAAKLVDLDPQQQLASQIWGLRLYLADTSGVAAFNGEFVPTPFADIWARYPQGSPDSFFGAMYQSIITAVQWGTESTSPFLRQLQQHGSQQLSIKFNVDGYNDDFTSPTFTQGRIVGSIGPYSPDEPKHFVAARMLWPPGVQRPLLNAAPCRIDAASGMLFLDLGNSLPTTTAGGPLQNLGTLWIAALPPHAPPVLLASVAGMSDTFYTQHAGILSAQLSYEQVMMAAQCRIGIFDTAGTNLLLAESDNATFVRADDVIFRMSPRPPDNVARTLIFATSYGQVAANVMIAVQHQPMPGQTKRGPATPVPVGIPESALTFPAAVVTDAQGRAELALAAGPPGNPRGFIDGQIYSVIYGRPDDPAGPPGTPLSVLVWDDYDVPEQPTWVADVQPILQQYANLYPAMQDVFDLASYSSVVLHRDVLKRVLQLPIEDPNFMPVTRDLSPAKRSMLVRWLGEKEPPLFAINDLANLRQLLQLAIELEHATIPPYLCALFSLMPGRNREVAHIIHSVVTEEMLHMALACNLLNAVGGAPQIAKPAFVPRYPGHLPGGIRPELTVALRRCSKEQIRDVFMAIEEPARIIEEDRDKLPTLDLRGVEVDQTGRMTNCPEETIAQIEQAYTQIGHERLTIGWFYHRIACAIVELEQAGTTVFVGDPARQLTPSAWPGVPGRLYAVTDKASALLAIHEIVQQGEGTSSSDPSAGGNEVAHYFRFREIVEGRQLIKNDEGQWVFEGREIPFDPADVYPMGDDPDTGVLDPGSAAGMASALFDEMYADLLRALHLAVNGEPMRLADAIGLMYSLRVQARNLLSIPISPGSPITAGPSFQPVLSGLPYAIGT